MLRLPHNRSPEHLNLRRALQDLYTEPVREPMRTIHMGDYQIIVTEMFSRYGYQAWLKTNQAPGRQKFEPINKYAQKTIGRTHYQRDGRLLTHYEHCRFQTIDEAVQHAGIGALCYNQI